MVRLLNKYYGGLNLDDDKAHKFGITYLHTMSKRTNIYALYGNVGSDDIGNPPEGQGVLDGRLQERVQRRCPSPVLIWLSGQLGSKNGASAPVLHFGLLQSHNIFAAYAV